MHGRLANGSRMDRHWTRKRIAWIGVLSAVVLTALAQGSARAGDDDDDANSIWNLDKRVIDGFAKGLGLKRGDELGIDYRERSPLVVPPSRDLPPPETAGANRTAAWPVDPDAKRRQDAATKKKLDRRGWDEDAESRPLLPSELNPPGTSRPSTTGSTARTTNGNENANGTNMQPSQLGYFGGLFSGSAFGFGGPKEEYGTFTKEPARSSLTAPPVGYQTPSAAQPYGVSKDQTRQRPDKQDPAVGNLGQ
jgi:hypothetical protein